MASNLMGPGSRGSRTASEVRDGQRQARRDDANASAHPNKVTLSEIRRSR